MHVDEEDCMTLSYKACPKTGQASLWMGNDYSNKTLINESGLYSLIMASKLPQAKAFKHWVTSEVLPQIRKTGGYIPVPKVLLDALKPKVQFAEAVMGSEDCIYIGDLAKLIASNGVEVGRSRLFRWMRGHGYLFKNERRPMQKWMDKGLFEVEETVVDNGRRIWLNLVTKVTPKGQEYFVNGFVTGRFYIDCE